MPRARRPVHSDGRSTDPLFSRLSRPARPPRAGAGPRPDRRAQGRGAGAGRRRRHARRQPSTPHLLDGCAIAVGADAPEAELAALSQAAQRAGIPVNVVDRPELCSFITPAIVDRDADHRGDLLRRRRPGPGAAIRARQNRGAAAARAGPPRRPARQPQGGVAPAPCPISPRGGEPSNACWPARPRRSPWPGRTPRHGTRPRATSRAARAAARHGVPGRRRPG